MSEKFEVYAKSAAEKILNINNLHDFAVVSKDYFMEARVELKEDMINIKKRGNLTLIGILIGDIAYIQHSPVFSVSEEFGSAKNMLELWTNPNEQDQVYERLLITADQETESIIEEILQKNELKFEQRSKNYKILTFPNTSKLHVYYKKPIKIVGE